MNDYTIHTFQPEFIEMQAEVGKEVVKNWIYLKQTLAEDLKKIYSQPDFDPETRLYCFKGDKMVGFLTAKVIEEVGEKIGWLRFPFVLDEYDEAKDLLMENIIEVFRQKKIKKMQGVAGSIWGDTLDVAKRWDFKVIGDRAISYILNIEDYQNKHHANDVKIETFSHETDLEQIIEIYQNELKVPREITLANFNFIKSYEKMLEHIVIKEDGIIKAQGLLYRDEDPEIAIQVHSFVKNDEYYYVLQDRLVEKCRVEGIKFIKIFLRDINFYAIPKYEELGFTFETKTLLLEREI